MKRLMRRKYVTGLLLALLITASILVGVVNGGRSAIHATGPRMQYAPYPAFARSIAAHHKAPFLNKYFLTRQQMEMLAQRTVQPAAKKDRNIKVNQDHNPWPKLEVAASVNPLNGQDYVVATNDFREGYNHMFYHVSHDSGRSWSDDALTVSVDQEISAPYSYQSEPGVAFDRAGHTFISNLAGNLIADSFSGYINYDNEIDVTVGFANGTYTSLNTSAVDYVACNGESFTGIVDCRGQFDKPFITVDNVPGSPRQGTIYVYYTYVCNGVPTASGDLAPCTDGSATIPPLGSAILESHAAGVGKPFSSPSLVSGPHTQTQFSDMVIDKQGQPHIFFDDYTSYPTINMYESSYIHTGLWKVSKAPVVTFQYNGLNNGNWQFQELGTIEPGCAIHVNTAYCAFSASQIGSGPVSDTPSVYLAVVDTDTALTDVHRVNNDPINDTKDHFFPWASVSPKGAVYVGWYDNRNDPFNSRIQYFVGKSTDGGKTFPRQQPVSDALFNPCVGYPSCLSFGNYTQLITGPDGITHAAWSDTRDGASAQIYTQAITW